MRTDATWPLVAHEDAREIVAYRGQTGVSLARFLRDVAWVAASVPGRGPLLNACSDRYRFTVALAAALVSRRRTILPSSYAPATLRALLAGVADVTCLADEDRALGFAHVTFPELPVAEPRTRGPVVVPRVPAGFVAATVFTSGTTGTPVGHDKTWGSLVMSARAEANRLSVTRGYAVVGTVPPQHMYGLESTVMLPLQARAALSDTQPFYPHDIVTTLAALPRPRLFVTSPVHLRALLTSGLASPPLDAVLCATAPLPLPLACEAERRLEAPLWEIYGATEAGQMASRRPLVSEAWELFPGLVLAPGADGSVSVSGGHVAGTVALNDVIDCQDERHFHLKGRGSDIINVAGKRSSLAFLEHQLLAIPGVRDGVFYLPDEDLAGPVARLMAFVVAPGLTAAAVETALRARLDPAFLPRPLYLVDALPRLPSGKLTRAALRDLFVARKVSEGGG